MTDEVLSLPDLREALTDATGLLDMIAEHLVTHRHRVSSPERGAELQAAEDFVSQSWAHGRRARTLLTDYIATEEKNHEGK